MFEILFIFEFVQSSHFTVLFSSFSGFTKVLLFLDSFVSKEIIFSVKWEVFRQKRKRESKRV